MTFQKLKPWLVLALIFLIGVVTGGALTIGLAPHFMHPPGAQQRKMHWMTHLTQRLDLTADQQAKIQPILTDAENQVQSVHKDEIDRISKIMETANNRISPLLTPNQQVELKKMESEREKMFSGHMRSWGPPHEGPDTPPPPPSGQPAESPLH